MIDQPNTVFLLGGSAEIGRALAERHLADGWRVAATARDLSALDGLAPNPRFHALPCDLSAPASVTNVVAAFRALGLRWDRFVSCVGTLDPIGSFFETDFDEWQESVTINSLAQLRVLHGLFPLRRPDFVASACLFAGGGTNSPFTNYSAYCAAKILLIKMAELIDDETSDLNIFIIGPGYVKTRIHDQTIRAGDRAGVNYAKTVEFLKTTGTTMDDIYQCIEWCAAQGRPVAGGRNFSAVHDPWRGGGAALASALERDGELFKLRRRSAPTATTP